MLVIRCLIYIPLVCSLLPEVYSQCSGSAQLMTVGYSTVSFSQPGYPSGYADNLNCVWSVTTEISGKSILFRVTDMLIDCAGDAINVYDGTSTSGTQEHTNECSSGGALKDLSHKVATSGSVYSVFASDGSPSSFALKGFKMYLISGDDFSGTGCSSSQSLTATGTEQILTSPSFPNEYPKSKNCEWTITTTSSTANVNLQIKFLDVESETNCGYDKLEIRESGSTLATICRSDWEPTETYTSTGNSLTVVFVADAHTSFRGFLVKYKEVDNPSASSTGNSGVLTAGEKAGIAVSVCSVIVIGAVAVYYFGGKKGKVGTSQLINGARPPTSHLEIKPNTNNNILNKTSGEGYVQTLTYLYPEKSILSQKSLFSGSFHDIIKERDFYN